MPSTFRRDAIIVLVAVALPLLYIAAAGGGFPLDDSWIHQTYGRNLAQVGEWAFTPGTPSTASTSPLYTLMLAAGHKLGIPVGLWTHGLGIICLALAGLIAARMAERLAPNARNIGLYAGLAVVAAWHLVWAAASGMETMVFSLFMLLLPYLAWRELDHTAAQNPLLHALERGAIRPYLLRGAVFGVAAGLATLARPEGAMMVGLLGMALVVARPGMTWRALFVYGAAAVAAFLLVLTPYLLFNLQVTGGLLPNTAASKRADLVFLFERPYLQRIIDLLIPLTAGGQILLLPGALVFAWSQMRAVRREPQCLLLLVPLAWSVGLILLYAAYLPAYFQHGRYVIPSLGTFIVCGVAGTVEIVRWGRRTLARRVLARGLVVATIAVYAVMALVLGLTTYASDVAIIDGEMVAAARWIAANVPDGELMAIHDIGAVGYFAPRSIIDLAGLVSPELLPVIPVELNGEAVWAILRERDARYVMGFADQVPGGDPNDSRLCAVFRARGQTAEVSDTYNMSIYRIVWDGNCPE